MLTYVPETTRIDITGRCNLRCTHCQADMFLGKKHLELSTQEWKSVFVQLASSGAMTLSFLGGEPFLRKDFLDLLEFASQLGLRTTVTTNGTLITEKIVSRLVDSTNTYTVFSLDGPTDASHDAIRGRGSFSKTISAIEIFSATQRQHEQNLMGISVVLHRGNIDCIEDVFDLAVNHGVDSLSVAVVHNTGRASSNWNNLKVEHSDLIAAAERIAKKASQVRDKIRLRMDLFPASFREYLAVKVGVVIPHEMLTDSSGIKECYIQHDGRVFPTQQCSEMIPSVLNGAGKLGITFANNSLRQYSFKEIWNNKEFGRFRSNLLGRGYVDKLYPCNTCKFRHSYCQPSMGQFLKGETTSHPLCVFVAQEHSDLTIHSTGPAQNAAQAG